MRGQENDSVQPQNLAPPTDAELAAIQRGALFILVGFVLSILARLVFEGATYVLSSPAAHDIPRMRSDDAPDPDFLFLLPLLTVLLIAKLIEAFGKTICLSRPERLSYWSVHLSLACDFAALIGIVLRLFNFGRAAGPILPWIFICDLVGLAAMPALALFFRGLARLLGKRGITTAAGINFVATTVLIVGTAAMVWSGTSTLGPTARQAYIVGLIIVAATAAAAYIAMLAKILSRKLAEPPPTGST